MQVKSVAMPFLLAALSCVVVAQADQPPAVDDASFIQTPSIPFGSRIQRTMKLLATSTPEHKHRVRILFYGQSITNGWTDIVLKNLKKRFPNADIVCENRAIGGFSAPALSQTAQGDLYPFYPDLLFFQDYNGPEPEMEQMFAEIHNRTTAEVLVFTHHIDHCAPDKTRERDSATLRKLADKYGFEVVDIFPSWKKYLEVTKIDRLKLLGDGIIHLNQDGKNLMARIAMPHLTATANQPAADQDRVRYYNASGSPLKGSFDHAKGKAIHHPLKMEFTGNRVDIAIGPTKAKLGTAKILIDGKTPSQLEGVYAMTRSNSCPGNWFPALRRVEIGKNAVAESWELTITKINDKCTDFEYEVKGSATGPDGKGTSKAKFTSTSGRLSIDPKWFAIPATYSVFKKHVPVGFTVKWKVVEQFQNELKPSPIKDTTKEDLYTVAQGFSNGPHTLEIIPNGDGAVPVKYIVVYQPPKAIEPGK
jgi:hypothetical protein